MMKRRVPYLPNTEARQRWSDLGFDVSAADIRFSELVSSLSGAASDDSRLDAWVAAEQQVADAAGIPFDDPDLWRIAAAPKHIYPAQEFAAL